ncbi:unnamed protein product [Schistosoma curassoni]|nr:unnamed protein product [Schistosoma curassoni]
MNKTRRLNAENKELFPYDPRYWKQVSAKHRKSKCFRILNDGILVLLLVSTTVRKKYPVNIVLLMLYIIMIVCAVYSAMFLIILMLSVGQATFGRQDVRIAGDDYCLAALILYTVLMMDWLTAIQNFQYFTNNTLNETQTNNYRQVSFEVLRSNRMLLLY